MEALCVCPLCYWLHLKVNTESLNTEKHEKEITWVIKKLMLLDYNLHKSRKTNGREEIKIPITNIDKSKKVD